MDLKDKVNFKNKLTKLRINKIITESQYKQLVELTKNDLYVAKYALRTIIITS